MQQTRRILILATALISLVSALFYLLCSHADCLQWYMDLNPYFYKSGHWQTSVFTPGFKTVGNTYALLLMATAVLSAYCLWQMPAVRLFKLRRIYPAPRIAAYGFVAVSGLLLALVMHMHCNFANDEVFSAVHFAGLHPFQTVSHYPLPNNHVLFNLMNAGLAALTGNPLLSGRLLSALLYTAALLVLHAFISQFKTEAVMKYTILAVLAMQFSFWGFSAQARGYGLVFLCSTGVLYCFNAYCYGSDKQAISGLFISLTAGMFSMPSFLYWSLGTGLAGLFWMLKRKQSDRLFILCMTGTACTVLLLYGPLILFSGFSAITDNPYTKAATTSIADFIPVLFLQKPYFEGLIQEWTGFGVMPALQCLAILTPLLLIYYLEKDSPERKLILFAASLFAAFAICTLVLRNLPFYRNLGNYGLFTVLLFMLSMSRLLKPKAARWLYLSVLLAYAGFECITYPEKAQSALYYHDVRTQNAEMAQTAGQLNKGSTVFLHEDAFYWWHVLQAAGFSKTQIHINKAMHQEDLLILPVTLLNDSIGPEYRPLKRTKDFIVLTKF